MATTWLKPLHRKVGKSLLHTLGERTDYAQNPEKTVNNATEKPKHDTITDSTGYVQNPAKTNTGELVKTYACDPRTVDEEFYIAKREYEHITGRNQGKRDVIAYHIRQAFKPGEITPQEALEAGYELGVRFTKGNHAFIVGVHTDRAHVHCHIIFNSTSLDYTRKFKNFWGSSFAIRRLSDLICAEHGLSVIESPKPSKGQNYDKWLGGNKPPTWSDVIKNQIDESLPSCATFDSFIAALKAAGYAVKENRKHISVCATGQKRPTRLDTLGGDYSEAAIRARLGMVKVRTGGGDSGTKTRVNLLVDIQEKLRDGKGAGYAQWAKIFNIKETAKTLIFLKENGIDSYEDLVKKSSLASGDFANLTKRIREIEVRQKEISELQKQIGTYGKTRDIYEKYKKSGWDRGFYDIHAADIILHRAAKKYFNELGMKKLPSINQLKQEYGTLAAELKTLYGEYHKLKSVSRELSIARHNAERILGVTTDAQNRDVSRAHTQNNNHNI